MITETTLLFKSCLSKPLTALRIFKNHYYTHDRGLLLSVGSVESGNQADAMVADDHNPRREPTYGNGRLLSK